MSNVNVQVQRELDFSSERVWGILGDFGNLSWAPGPDRIEVIGAGPGMIRRLFMPGMAPIDEVLESIDHGARTFSYSIPRGLPMPISNYLAAVRLEDLPGERCRVHWSATGDSVGISGEQASEILTGAYAQLLGWLEDVLGKG